jgi:hypothetical protein
MGVSLSACLVVFIGVEIIFVDDSRLSFGVAMQK